MLTKTDWSAISLQSRAPQDPVVRRLLALYMQMLANSMTPGTVRRRERNILYWIYHLEDRGIAVADATEEDALGVLAAWRGPDGWSDGAMRHFITSLRDFHEWLLDYGHAARNPWRKVRARKPPKKLPRFLSPEEIHRMIDTLDRPHWRDIRDRAMLLFLYSTACRVSEACTLDMSALDLDRGVALVMGKGRKEGYVVVAPRAAEAIRLYLRAVRPRLADTTAGPVFLGLHGRAMTTTAVRDALIRAAQRAGIDRHVHPHMIRHTAATHMHMAGADIRLIQEYLRHEDIGTTAIYTHVNPAAVQDAHRQFHPLAQE
jgi:site-specific recombinase XerD